MPQAKLIRPDRVRAIERPFGWLPCRLITGGLLRTMNNPAKLLYLHLALAADRRGLSFWGDTRIQEAVGLSAAELCQARQQLINLDLLAFDGHTYQLLSLPSLPRPSDPSAAPARSAPRATVDHAVVDPSSESAPTAIPDEARRILRRLRRRDFSG